MTQNVKMTVGELAEAAEERVARMLSMYTLQPPGRIDSQVEAAILAEATKAIDAIRALRAAAEA